VDDDYQKLKKELNGLKVNYQLKCNEVE